MYITTYLEIFKSKQGAEKKKSMMWFEVKNVAVFFKVNANNLHSVF